MPVCPKCGGNYSLLCIRCRRASIRESVEFLTDKHGLELETLIKALAAGVRGEMPQGAAGYLFKALQLKDAFPSTKAEITGAEGGPLEIADAKSRLTDLVARLTTRIAEREDN
jgi:hypothetical protein